MPEVIPKLNETEVKEWSAHSYPDLVYLISRKFISEEEIPSHALKGKPAFICLISSEF